jgi:hypothetical protein
MGETSTVPFLRSSGTCPPPTGGWTGPAAPKTSGGLNDQLGCGVRNRGCLREPWGKMPRQRIGGAVGKPGSVRDGSENSQVRYSRGHIESLAPMRRVPGCGSIRGQSPERPLIHRQRYSPEWEAKAAVPDENGTFREGGLCLRRVF